MERLKLVLDVLSGVIVPIIVAIIPLVWVPLNVAQFLRRIFYPGLIAIVLVTVSAIGYGLATGLYSQSEPDPLVSLTDAQKKWFGHFVDENDDPKVSLEKFYVNETTRYLFLTANRDLYEIERVRGSVNGPNPLTDTYDFPIAQLTETGKHKVAVKFVDRASKSAINYNEREVKELPGTGQGKFYYLTVPVHKDFDFIQCGYYPHTVGSPGSLDTIAVPMGRYKGGYSTFVYVIFFDKRIEKAGLYDIERHGDGVFSFLYDKDVHLSPSKIAVQPVDDSLLPSTINAGLKTLENADDSIVSAIQKTKWVQAYRFSISKLTSPVAFQFIIYDE